MDAEGVLHFAKGTLQWTLRLIFLCSEVVPEYLEGGGLQFLIQCVDKRAVLNLEGTLVPEHVQTCCMCMCMCMCVCVLCVCNMEYGHKPVQSISMTV